MCWDMIYFQYFFLIVFFKCCFWFMMVNDVDGYYFNRMLFHLIEVSKVSTFFLVDIHQVVYFLLVSTFSHSDITSIITSCVMMKHHFIINFHHRKIGSHRCNSIIEIFCWCCEIRFFMFEFFENYLWYDTSIYYTGNVENMYESLLMFWNLKCMMYHLM